MTEDREPQLTTEEDTDTSAVEATEAAEDGPAARVGRRFKHGAQNLTAGLRHTVLTRHQTDEEIRRMLVLRQLTAYEAVRETAREELEEVRREIIKAERRGADSGWSEEEKAEVKELRRQRKAREAALHDLMAQEFTPVQPTKDDIDRARHLGSTKRVAGLVVLVAAVVALCIAAPRMLLLVLLGALFAVWWAGRRRPALSQRPIPERLLARPELAPPPITEDQAADGDPEEWDTDIRGVEAPDRAQDCIQRALIKEGVRLREVHSTTRTGWGWQTTAVLRSGTTADVVRVLPKLVTDLRVGGGRTMAAPANPDDGAEVAIRVLTSDPFANPPAYPERTPLSCSIRDPFSPFISLDGEPTDIVLSGVHALVCAVTGGGKSALIRSLAEYVTACRDAVAVDIDPTGKGLGPFRHAAARTAHTVADAEKELKRLVKWAERRISALTDENDNWEVKPEAPAIIVFLDEYPHLSKKAKQYALTLLRIGRKARITLVVATQDATEDIMGDAVADSFGIRVMLPCRMADVPEVVGSKTAVSEGWLPHLLTPGDEKDPADAGKCYVHAPRHKTPILRYVVPLSADAALKLAQARAAEGLPQVDAVTTGEASASRPLPQIAELMLTAFKETGAEALTTAQLLEKLAAAEPKRWTQWDDREDRLAMAGREIKKELRAAGLDVPSGRLNEFDGRPTGYRLADLRAALDQVPA